MDTTQISRRQILVVGSCNTDMVIKAAHLPRPGETILGGTFFMNPGGKGANQAVAIARLGGSVTFICKTGSDIFGHQSQQLFEEEGINTSYVFSDSGNPSGVALITVDEKAENCIVVASGANANLLPSDLAKAEEAIELADLILMQLEVPMETVCFVADIAWQKGKKVILNPAPAHPLPADLLHHLYLITPNETEAEMITNIFEFDDKVASDIMTHRKNVVALESTMTLKETVDFIVKEANNSRFPVYEEDIDNIVGVLHMRDVLYFAEQEEYLDRPISQIDGLLRSAHFAPEAKNINALFKEMQSEKIHMEIVIDEYGQTAGIVTMEDILEEIVGNIMDEYDNEEPDIVVKENGSFQLSGMTPLDDVEDALEMEFDEDDKDNFDTLNGFLISRLGHLPEDDEKGQVVFGGYRFSIVKAENKIIQTVAAERDAGPEHEKENEG